MRNGRCRLHGGATPSGFASPHAKHGKYFKYLRADVLDRYEASRSDPDLLALKDEIALIDSQTLTLLAEYGDVELIATWADLAWLKLQMNKYRASNNNAGMAQTISAILDCIDVGAGAVAKREEVNNLIERRRRLVETERKRQIAMKLHATAEEQMLLVMKLAALVKEYVTDGNALRAISAGLTEFIDARSSPAVIAGGE